MSKEQASNRTEMIRSLFICSLFLAHLFPFFCSIFDIHYIAPRNRTQKPFTWIFRITMYLTR